LNAVIEGAQRTLARTATVTWRLDGATAFGRAHAPVFAHGSFDFRSARGTEIIDLPELPRQEPGTENAIFLPAQLYLQPKGTTGSVLPRGKQWLSVTPAASESVQRNFPQFLGQAEGVNPLLLLDEVAWGATTAVPMGRRVISGVPLHEYAVSVDLAQALSRTTGPGADTLGLAIQEQLTALGSGRSSGEPKVPVSAWVDDAGQLVQVQAALPGTGEGTALMTVRSFGTAVPAQPPAASAVLDIRSLTPSGERENNGGGDSDGA
jgi:hypothetical protein